MWGSWLLFQQNLGMGGSGASAPALPVYVTLTATFATPGVSATITSPGITCTFTPPDGG